LHQLGTRTYALGGDESAAVELLEDALGRRNDARDAEGAANTQHNLDFIRGGGGAHDGEDGRPPDDGGWHWPGRGVLAGAGATLALVVVVVAVVALAGNDSSDGGGGGAAPRADIREPAVRIIRPGDGATFTVGDRIRARFQCKDDQPDVVCRAAVRRGARDRPKSLKASGWKRVGRGDDLPNELGRYTLTVIARDAAGNRARDSATYAVQPAAAVAACSDRQDNDGDELIDLDDSGCASLADDDETDTPVP
jgi:hypothetical protein